MSTPVHVEDAFHLCSPDRAEVQSAQCCAGHSARIIDVQRPAHRARLCSCKQHVTLSFRDPVAPRSRDLKAENVLLRLDGAWVLADFGSASRASGVIEGAAAIMRAEVPSSLSPV